MDGIVFSQRELSLLLAIVKGLDPERYAKDEAKALIHKVRAAWDTESSVWFSND